MNVHIITGGSSGIGLEVSKRFKDGTVLIAGRGEEKLIKAVEELKSSGVSAVYKQVDVADIDSIKELFEYGKTLGDIKTVVNSAGVSGIGIDAKLTFEIDLIGTENIIATAENYMSDGGVVIVMASIMGYVAPSCDGCDDYLTYPTKPGAIEALVKFTEDSSDIAYNLSKRGVQLLVKRFAMDYGEKGIRIVSISPGIIVSPMSKKAEEENPEIMNYMKSMTPLRRYGEVSDIANMIEFVSSDKARFITGTDIVVDGGLTPRLSEVMSEI